MFALCFVFLNSPWEASLLCLEHGALLPSSPPANSSRAEMMPRADCPGGFRIRCPEAEKALGWDSWKPGPSREPGAHQHLCLQPAPGAAVQRPVGRGQASSWLHIPLPVSRVFGFKSASPNDHTPFSLTASVPCYCAKQPGQVSPSFSTSLGSPLKRGSNFLPAHFLGIEYLMSSYYVLGSVPGFHTIRPS